MRSSALALAGLLALPALATAQDGVGMPTEQNPQILPRTRFAVTLFGGARVPYTSGEYFVFTESGDQFRVEEERGGGFSLGVEGEVALRGPFSAIASLTYTSSDQDIYSVIVPGDSVTSLQFQSDGPTVWLAKAGLRARLPDPFRDARRHHPSAFVHVAPALVWVRQGDVEGFPELGDDNLHFALNLGADAVTRIGRGPWALSVGLEDYITFWDTESFRDRDEVIFSSIYEEPVQIEYDYGTSNILLIRVGVSYRH